MKSLLHLSNGRKYPLSVSTSEMESRIANALRAGAIFITLPPPNNKVKVNLHHIVALETV